MAPYAAGFAQELVGQHGYTPASACRQLNLMAHASRWLASQDLHVGDLDPSRVAEFCQARRAQGYVGYLSPKAMAPLLAYLRQRGVLGPAPPVGPPTAAQALIGRYVRYLVIERGVAPATVRSYVRTAGQFLSQLPSPLELALTTADVTKFLTATCPGLAPASARCLTTGLRSLLRFLHVEGEIPTALAQAVPAAAGVAARLAARSNRLEGSRPPAGQLRS